MTKDGDVGRERLEEAFETLSAPEGGGGAAGPWKMTTIALLVVSLGMAVLFSSNEMRESREDLRRIAAAEEEVAAVRMFTADGDYPGAVAALQVLGERLAEVDGAEAAAVRLADEVGEVLDELDTFVARDRRRADAVKLNTKVVRALIVGNPDAARRILGARADASGVSRALEELAVLMSAWNEAAAADREDRLTALRAVAEDWELPAVRDALGRAEAEARREEEVAAALAAARKALEEDDTRTADAALLRAARNLGRPEILPLHIELFMSRIVRGAEAWEEAGKPEAAAALFRAAAIYGDREAAVRAERLEAAMRAAIEDEHLRTRLEEFAKLALSREEYEASAAYLDALGELNGSEVAAVMSRRTRAVGHRERAKSLASVGEFEAALVAARESATLDREIGGRMIEEIRARIRERERRETLRRAEAALADGAPRHAAALFGDDEVPPDLGRRIVGEMEAEAIRRAEAALADGAPGHAFALLDGIDAPEKLRTAVTEGLRAQALSRARAALDRGDGAAARKELGKAGSLDEKGRAELAARAEILAGRTDVGLARLPADADVRARVLLAAARTLLTRDASRAADLAERARKLTSATPDVLAILAATLDRLDRADPRRKEIWTALRDAALKEAPLPR